MTLESPSAATADVPTLDDPAWPADTTAPGDAARLLATVVGWHNRHPLARRLAVADVGGLGTLVVPVLASPATGTDGASPGWKSRLKRLVADTLAWRPGRRSAVAFAEVAVIPGVSAGRVSRFAHAFGQADRPSPPTWPQRVLPVVHDAAAETRHLFAAAFKTGPQTTRRVLVGTGRGAPVLGQRQWSRVRLGVAVSLSLALAAGGGAWLLLGPALPMPSVAHPTGMVPAHPASGAAPTAAPASTPAAMAQAGAVGSASAVPASANAVGAALEAHATLPSVSASAPAPEQPAEPADGHITPAHAVAHPPPADAPEAMASNQAQSGPAAEAMPAVHTVPAARVPSARARPLQAATAPVPTRHHALVSPPTWRRADLDRQRQRLIRWMAQERSPLQLDVLRRPDGEVLALWPLATAADAELLSRRLQRAGVTLVVMDF